MEDQMPIGYDGHIEEGVSGEHTFEGMTVQQGADFVWDELTDDDKAYAAADGFSALHDIMDANMLLPFVNDESIWWEDSETGEGGIVDEYTDWANAVMDEVDRRLKAQGRGAHMRNARSGSGETLMQGLEELIADTTERLAAADDRATYDALYKARGHMESALGLIMDTEGIEHDYTR